MPRSLAYVPLVSVLGLALTSTHASQKLQDDPVVLGHTASMVTPLACAECPCPSDPHCDGAADVLDVAQVVNIAFRGTPPVYDPACPQARADVNCDDCVDILDVKLVIDVAFQGSLPSSLYCDPCICLALPCEPGSPAMSGAVSIESKSVEPGDTGVEAGVSLTNAVPIDGLVLAFELRSTSGGAYIASSFSFGQVTGSRLETSALGNGSVTNARYSAPDAQTCSGPSSSSYATAGPVDFVSPDAILYAAMSQDVGVLAAGADPAGSPSLRFTFSVNNSPGTFVIDTCCVTPCNHLAMVNASSAQMILPSFTPGVITILNTPTGSNVSVDMGDIDVEFSQVSTAGNTTVSVSSSGPPPPVGFDLVPVSPAQYYDIQTTASYTGPVAVCIAYQDAWLTGPEPDLRIMHYENGSWVDQTSSLDVFNNIICGEVSSLSPFILVEPSVCACDCHADPGNCDGVPTILDVVQCVNVAFRNAAAILDPNANCPYQTTDVNCDAVTTVIDVVKLVNVTFRNANAATEFCNPCP